MARKKKPQELTIATLRTLVCKSRELYPTSRRMQRDWVRAKLTYAKAGPKVRLGCGSSQLRAVRSTFEAETFRRVDVI